MRDGQRAIVIGMLIFGLRSTFPLHAYYDSAPDWEVPGKNIISITREMIFSVIGKSFLVIATAVSHKNGRMSHDGVLFKAKFETR